LNKPVECLTRIAEAITLIAEAIISSTEVNILIAEAIISSTEVIISSEDENIKLNARGLKSNKEISRLIVDPYDIKILL
jgi:hypothetical protein